MNILTFGKRLFLSSGRSPVTLSPSLSFTVKGHGLTFGLKVSLLQISGAGLALKNLLWTISTDSECSNYYLIVFSMTTKN